MFLLLQLLCDQRKIRFDAANPWLKRNLACITAVKWLISWIKINQMPGQLWRRGEGLCISCGLGFKWYLRLDVFLWCAQFTWPVNANHSGFVVRTIWQCFWNWTCQRNHIFYWIKFCKECRMGYIFSRMERWNGAQSTAPTCYVSSPLTSRVWSMPKPGPESGSEPTF